jgi:hypothetical protein
MFMHQKQAEGFSSEALAELEIKFRRVSKIVRFCDLYSSNPREESYSIVGITEDINFKNINKHILAGKKN